MRNVLILMLFFFAENVLFAAVLPINLKQHADSTPVKIRKNHVKLTKYLIKTARNEEEKVLIISYWISKNIIYDKSEVRRLGRNKKANELLQNRRGVCGCIANLFQQMCDDAAVKCATINGNAYGNFYKRYFTYFHLRHDWNAVYLSGEWKLVDATWDIDRVKTTQFKKDRKLEWVFKNPSDFASSHFPNNPSWQLINDIYTKKDFWRQQSPVKKDYMFVDSLKYYLDSSKVLAQLSSIKSAYYFDHKKEKFINSMNALGWRTIFDATDSIQIAQGLIVYHTLNEVLKEIGFEKYKKQFESTLVFIENHKEVGILARK